MSAALDEDLTQRHFHGEWLGFWQGMRHLYSRTTFHLATGARTGDARSLRLGKALWAEIKASLDRAGHRLDLPSGSDLYS